MGISASTGPHIVYGAGPAPTDYNGQRAPSLYDQFLALLDPRPLATYQPGQADNSPVCGWQSGGVFCCVDQAPSTAANNNIVAAGTGSGAGNQTLVSSSGAGITVGVSISRIDAGETVAGLLAIDTAQTRVSYGQTGSVQLWNPVQAIARNIVIQSGSNNSGVTFTVNGYDLYGQPVSENITGPNNTTANGKKAFKYISSVARSATITGNVNVGTGDIFGFPLRTDVWGDATIFWNDALITATTGWLAAVTTDPATATTGDVRGTYAVQSAADGTKKLRVWMQLTPARVATTAGLLGVTQYST